MAVGVGTGVSVAIAGGTGGGVPPGNAVALTDAVGEGEIAGAGFCPLGGVAGIAVAVGAGTGVSVAVAGGTGGGVPPGNAAAFTDAIGEGEIAAVEFCSPVCADIVWIVATKNSFPSPNITTFASSSAK